MRERRNTALKRATAGGVIVELQPIFDKDAALCYLERHRETSVQTLMTAQLDDETLVDRVVSLAASGAGGDLTLALATQEQADPSERILMRRLRTAPSTGSRMGESPAPRDWAPFTGTTTGSWQNDR